MHVPCECSNIFPVDDDEQALSFMVERGGGGTRWIHNGSMFTSEKVVSSMLWVYEV